MCTVAFHEFDLISCLKHVYTTLNYTFFSFASQKSESISTSLHDSSPNSWVHESQLNTVSFRKQWRSIALLQFLEGFSDRCCSVEYMWCRAKPYKHDRNCFRTSPQKCIRKVETSKNCHLKIILLGGYCKYPQTMVSFVQIHEKLQARVLRCFKNCNWRLQK